MFVSYKNYHFYLVYLIFLKLLCCINKRIHTKNKDIGKYYYKNLSYTWKFKLRRNVENIIKKK